VKPLDPFHFLREHTQKELDEISRDLGRAYQKLHQESQQGELLTEFLGEYRARMGHLSQLGTHMPALMNFQAFLLKIEKALEHQSEVTEALKIEIAEIRQRFIALKGRVRSFEVLIERREKAALHKEARREQGVADAYALYLHQKNTAHGDS
jgi:flagellar FliJ protein